MAKYSFDPFVFDTQSLELEQSGLAVKLRPKAAEVLARLLEARHTIVTKEFLLERCWPGVTVSENNLFQAIKELRSVLGRGDADVTYIKTFPKQGYQFISRVSKLEPVLNSAELLEPIQKPNEGKGPEARRLTWIRQWRWLVPLVLILAIFWWFGGRNHPVSSTEKSEVEVAVLPFENLNGKQESAWFSAAVAEALRNGLQSRAQIVTLSTNRTQAWLRDYQQMPELTGRTLDNLFGPGREQRVISGSYTHFGGQLRLELAIHQKSGEVVKTATFRGREREWMRLIDEAVINVSHTLLGELSGANRKPPSLPSKGDAMRFYAEGMRRMAKLDGKAAIPFFERALEEQPDQPMVALALSRAWSQLGFSNHARKWAQKALDHVGDVEPEYRLSIAAQAAEAGYDFETAIQSYRQLFSQFPGRADHGYGLVRVLCAAGRTVEAEKVVAEMRFSEAAQPSRLQLLAADTARARGDQQGQYQAARQAAELASAQGSRTMEAEARLLMARALRLDGKIPEALEAGERAIVLFQESGDLSGVALAMRQKGNLHMEKGHLLKAEEIYEQTLSHWQRLGNLTELGKTHQNLGTAAMRRSRFEEAVDQMEKGRAFFGETGSADIRSLLLNYGVLAVKMGRIERAQELLNEAGTWAQRVGDSYAMAMVEANRALIYYRQGDLQATALAYERALTAAKSAKRRNHVGLYCNNLAQVYVAGGELEKATHYFKQAEQIHREIGQTQKLGISLFWQAELARHMNLPDLAAERFQAARTTFNSIGLTNDVARMDLGLVEVNLEQGDLAKALALFLDAKAHLSRTNSAYLMDCHRIEGQLLVAREQTKQGIAAVRKAVELSQQRKSPRHELQARNVLAMLLINQAAGPEARQESKEATELADRLGHQLWLLEAEINQAFLRAASNMAEGKASLQALAERAERFGALRLHARILQMQRDLITSERLKREAESLVP